MLSVGNNYCNINKNKLLKPIKANRNILKNFTFLIVSSYFLFTGLTHAKPFLATFSISILLALLMLPVSKKLEQLGWSRGWAVFACDLILLVGLLAIAGVLTVQINMISEDWPEIKKKAQPKIQRIEDFVKRNTGISLKQQKQEAIDEAKNSTKNSTSGVLKILGSVTQIVSNSLLVFVYVFFLMLYRRHFKTFIMKLFSESQQDEAEHTLNESVSIAQKYLAGKFILIVILAVCYTIGLSIVGIKYAILISVIAALLSLIPYIGNIIGGGLALVMALLSDGGYMVVIGVFIVFSITQFIESYILEPFIVGRRVHLNPAISIIGVVLGGVVWGVAGMLIVIPYLGILKAVFDHVDRLEPFGYLLGGEVTKSESSFTEKLKQWFNL